MTFPSKIVLATHNAGKVKEFQAMFEPYDVKIIGADPFSETQFTELMELAKKKDVPNWLRFKKTVLTNEN